MGARYSALGPVGRLVWTTALLATGATLWLAGGCGPVLSTASQVAEALLAENQDDQAGAPVADAKPNQHAPAPSLDGQSSSAGHSETAASPTAPDNPQDPGNPLENGGSGGSGGGGEASLGIGLPDLGVLSVDTSDLAGDWQDVTVSGLVTAHLKNFGPAGAGPFDVTFFEDRNFNGRYDAGVDHLLGLESVPSLGSGATVPVSVHISAAFLFRNNLTYVHVDSSDSVHETVETNNYGNSGQTCAAERVGVRGGTDSITVCYNSAAYGIGGAYMAFVDDKLTNPANFGPNGRVQTTIQLVQMSSPITADALETAGCDCYQIGMGESDAGSGTSFNTLSLQDVREILAWSEANPARVVIGAQGYITEWGDYYSQTGAVNPMNATAYGEQVVFNGPFGRVLTGFNQGGAWRGAIVLGENDEYCVLIEDSSNPRKPVALIDVPAGDIFFSDVDIISSLGGVTNTPDIISYNDIVLANIYALVIRIVQDGPPNVCNAILPYPDVTASLMRFLCDAEPRSLTGRIGNGGATAIEAGLPVSFYDGEPGSGGALLGTTRTLFPMRPGLFEDVTLQLPYGFDCSRTVWVVADDSGGLTGALVECDEMNNTHSAQVESGFEQFTDASLAVLIEYTGTTYDHEQGTLVVQARARNIGTLPIDAPLMLVIEAMTDAGAVAANPDGYTPQGKPYFMFTSVDSQPSTLAPGEVSPEKTMIFRTRDAHVGFSQTFQARENRAPIFVSFPATSAVADHPYSYTAQAIDPDNQPLTYSLIGYPPDSSVDPSLPPRMQIAPQTGVITWTPNAASIGSHTIIVRANDTRGGSVEQRYVLDVSPVPVNRPPIFTTAPVTHVSVGASYIYNALAVDPDGDQVIHSLIPPTGSRFSIEPDSGRVFWEFSIPPDADHTDYPIAIRADDGRGANATQQYVLTVGDNPTNPHAPSLFGTPAAVAAVNALYFYQPAADDPDPGQTLTFSTLQAPQGLSINPATGRVTWTPTSGQTGSQRVEIKVDDGSGGSSTQAWDVQVLAALPNRPPVIDSIPNFIALINTPYEYDVSATDPEGQTITYSLVSPPVGMAIDPQSGLISWLPQVQATTVIVAVKATDPQGAFGSQVYELYVSPPNTDPQIVSTPVASTFIGQHYRYDVNAIDAEGHSIAYSLVTKPTGMSINQSTGLIAWVPTEAQLGAHPVLVRVVDRYGGLADQPFNVTVSADTVAPNVTIVATPDPASINQPFSICVQAGDNVSVVARTLTVDGEPQTLDASGCITLTREQVGVLHLAATAADAAGNVGTATHDLLVGDPADPSAPTIELTSPDPGSSLSITATAPFELRATITDNPVTFLQWEVRIARGAQDAPYQVISTGQGEVIDARVATFDPSMLANDTYYVIIWATDGTHSRTQSVLRVFVEGDRKLGNFSVSFTDLTIPVAGIPLVITRQYDSLDTRSGDFGLGWRLRLPGRVVDEPKEDPREALTVGSKVYVTRPDGRRVGFKVLAEPVSWLFSFIVYVRFDPEPGVTDDMSLPDPNLIVFNFGGFLDQGFGGDPFNPNTYVFKTREKVKYTIDEQDGLQRIEDIFGNTIDVTPGGLISSTGISLTFVRDGQGRITQIIEPDDPQDPDPPGTLDYVYGPVTGNLEEFWTQQKSDPPTRYHYENAQHPHYLTKVEDPLGNRIVQNVYDDTGRLVGQCNAMGNVGGLPADPCGDPGSVPENCTMFCLDSVSGIQTIINARGYRTDLVLDGRGNVIQERKFSADGTYMLVTQRSYWTLPGGELTDWPYTESLQTRVLAGQPVGTLPVRLTLTYDDRGNVLTRTEHGDEDRTWTYTYWPGCDKVATELDPMFNLTQYEYDADCNLRFITDALGGVSEFRYNDRGQRTHFIDAVVCNGTHPNVWRFHYDGYGLPSGLTDPLGRTSQTHFNLSGELEYQIDRRGWRIDFDYDDAHRVRDEIWRPNTSALEPGDLDHDRITEYTYSSVGLLTSAIDPDSALTIDYWPTGLVKWVDNLGTPGAPRARVTYGRWEAGVLLSGYDANGNVTHVMDEWGAGTPAPQGMTEYRYDEFDRLGNVLQYSVGGQVNPKRVDLQYYDTGLLQWLRRYSDLAATHNVANTFYDYDCFGCPSRVSEIHHMRPNGDTLERLTFERDRLNNVRSRTDSSGAHGLSYDGLRRLLVADHPDGAQPDEFYQQGGVGYDEVGNRGTSHLSTSYQYSYHLGLGGSQLRATDTRQYTYSLNGSVVRRDDLASGDATSFVYDHRDRAKSISISAGGFLDRSMYDVLNRRIKAEGTNGSRAFIHDALNVLIVTDDSGTPILRRLTLRNFDSDIADERAGVTRWLLKDQVHSVRAIIDNESQIIATRMFDEFGRLLAHEGPLDDESCFQSREFLPAAGVYYFRARWYDPELGRFLNEDPKFPFRYDFVYNNPLSFVDPSGENAIVEYVYLAYRILQFYPYVDLAYKCYNNEPIPIAFGTIQLPPSKDACAWGLLSLLAEDFLIGKIADGLRPDDTYRPGPISGPAPPPPPGRGP